MLVLYPAFLVSFLGLSVSAQEENLSTSHALHSLPTIFPEESDLAVPILPRPDCQATTYGSAGSTPNAILFQFALTAWKCPKEATRDKIVADWREWWERDHPEDFEGGHDDARIFLRYVLKRKTGLIQADEVIMQKEKTFLEQINRKIEV